MPFPDGGRWACFFGPGTLVDTGVPIFRPPRVVTQSGGIAAEDHGQLIIVNAETSVNVTIDAGRKAGFRTTLVQAGEGVANVVAAAGVTLEPVDMATAGKGSICFLIAKADNDFMLVGQTGAAVPIEGGEEAPVAPPVNIDIPMVSGPDGLTATVGQSLTCTMGNWDGMSEDSYAYAWKSDGTTDIVGAGNTYVLVAADAGHSISCIVTATNALGSTEAPPSNAVAVS